MRKICKSISVRADKSTGATRVRFNRAKLGETYDVLDLVPSAAKSPSDDVLSPFERRLNAVEHRVSRVATESIIKTLFFGGAFIMSDKYARGFRGILHPGPGTNE